MDLVIRGRSQDQRGARPWDSGRTRVEPGRTGPWGKGGPEWSQAGQDHGAREDHKAWREEQMGPREQEAAAAAVVECTPEGARGTGQSSSTE